MTEKFTRLKTYESYIRRITSNVSRNGEWINFSCPLGPYTAEHKYKEDKSPSAGAVIANSGKLIWHCYACKGAGLFTNLLRYLETKRKVSYTEIINNIENSEELPEYESRFLCSEVKEALSPLEYPDIFDNIEKYPEASKYLNSRGISLVTAKKLGLQYDSDSQRIVFPVKDAEGRIYGFTGRTILPDGQPRIKDYYFPKSEFILGREHWNRDFPVLIVEGLFGFAHLHEVVKGKYFPYNIGAIMGSNISNSQIDILLQFAKPVYVLLDNDKAGKVGMFGPPGLPHKGMLFELKDQLPTFLPRWPKQEIDGPEGKTLQEKNDPDQLTYDELYAMLQKSRLVL